MTQTLQHELNMLVVDRRCFIVACTGREENVVHCGRREVAALKTCKILFTLSLCGFLLGRILVRIAVEWMAFDYFVVLLVLLTVCIDCLAVEEMNIDQFSDFLG